MGRERLMDGLMEIYLKMNWLVEWVERRMIG